MKKVVKKLFFVWNDDKEKLFLEQMAKVGYKLTQVKLGKYIFEQDTPRNVVYQFDFKGIDKIPEDEYLSFYEDTNWNYSCKYGGWYYFWKEIAQNDTAPSIYSNNESKKAKYKRLLGFLLISGFPLYYQTIIMFPSMDASRLAFPSFYFFFRIVAVIFTVLHILAVARIFSIYKRISDNIKE